MLSEKERQLFGGSDAPVIAGISKYKTKLDIFRRVVEGFETEQTKPQRRGQLMEPVIRAMYEDEFGVQVTKPATIFGKPLSCLRASPDGIAVINGEKRVVEFKSASIHMAHEWGETANDTPIDYQAQCQFYLGVTNLNHADLVVLLGGDDLRTYTVEADFEVQAMLFEACEKFWKDHILTKKPPPIDGSDSCSQWLSQRFHAIGQKMVAPNEAEPWAQRFFAAKRALAVAEEKKKEAVNHLAGLCVNSKTMEGNGWRMTWVERKGATEIDWESLWLNEIQKRFTADQQVALLSKYRSEKPGFRYPMMKELEKVAA